MRYFYYEYGSCYFNNKYVLFLICCWVMIIFVNRDWIILLMTMTMNIILFNINIY